MLSKWQKPVTASDEFIVFSQVAYCRGETLIPNGPGQFPVTRCRGVEGIQHLLRRENGNAHLGSKFRQAGVQRCSCVAWGDSTHLRSTFRATKTTYYLVTAPSRCVTE